MNNYTPTRFSFDPSNKVAFEEGIKEFKKYYKSQLECCEITYYEEYIHVTVKSQAQEKNVFFLGMCIGKNLNK